MKNILKQAENAERLLKLTSDTMILLDKDGICVDIAVYNINLWFLKEDRLLGKNLFQLIPLSTYNQIYPDFKRVLTHKIRSTHNYEMALNGTTYFFKCIMSPFDGMVLCQYRDITERSQRKLELERKNQELNEIQKAALIGNWQYDSDTQSFKYAGHTDILCTEETQEINLNDYLKLILPEDRKSFTNWLKENLKGKMENSVDYRILLQEKIFYIRLKAFAREYHKDKNTILEGYIQNITDIQQRRNDINLLTHAINNSTEDIYSAHEDGTLIFGNRCFKERHGIGNTQDITKLKIYDLPSYGRDKKSWKEFAECVKRGETSQGYIVHNPLPLRPEVLAIEGNAYWVTSDKGEGTVWTFGRDVSTRIRHEQQIKQFNLILDKIIENLPAGIVVKDINNNFKYLYRNRESYNREIPIQEALGKDDFDFYPLETAQEKRAQDIEIAKTGKEMHWIAEERDGNGNPIYLDKRKMKIESNDFSPILLNIEWDITELEIIKRELQSSKEKAEMSDSLKSAFLANMSHEIRTPLNAIVGFSHLIAESDDAEERKTYYNIVNANNERLLQLINEILDLSKIESGTIEFSFGPASLHNLCREVHDAHIFRTPQGVSLVYEPSDESLMIETDKNRVFQVISNLIGNAVKFTKEGSISYGYKLVDNQIVFHVTDTGTGIEPEKVGRVFERFAKLNNHAQGTGLGLSICKSIVERLGGKISVNSEFGKGTTFTFTLPYTIANPANVDSSKKENGEGNIAGIASAGKTADSNVDSSVNTRHACILVAEDTDSNFDLLEAILGKDHQLIRAHDGMEAVTMFDEVKPDLILMDIKMPNLDGLEATKIIRELSATVPIIAQSAFAYEQDRKAAEEAGCNDFIAKPIADDKLKAMIHKWLLPS